MHTCRGSQTLRIAAIQTARGAVPASNWGASHVTTTSTSTSTEYRVQRIRRLSVLLARKHWLAFPATAWHGRIGPLAPLRPLACILSSFFGPSHPCRPRPLLVSLACPPLENVLRSRPARARTRIAHRVLLVTLSNTSTRSTTTTEKRKPEGHGGTGQDRCTVSFVLSAPVCLPVCTEYSVLRTANSHPRY